MNRTMPNSLDGSGKRPASFGRGLGANSKTGAAESDADALQIKKHLERCFLFLLFFENY